MKPGDLYLGLPNQEILLPAYGGRKVTRGFIEVIKERVAIDGTLCSDFVGKRPTWSISYDILLGPDMEAILDLYEFHTDLSFIEVDRQGNAKQYDVRFRPPAITRENIRKEWEWSGITLELEAVRCYS